MVSQPLALTKALPAIRSIWVAASTIARTQLPRPMEATLIRYRANEVPMIFEARRPNSTAVPMGAARAATSDIDAAMGRRRRTIWCCCRSGVKRRFTVLAL